MVTSLFGCCSLPIDRFPLSKYVPFHQEENTMRSIQEVLEEKSIAVERVRREIEALRLVAELLADEGESTWSAGLAFATTDEPVDPVVSSLPAEPEYLHEEVAVLVPEAEEGDVRFSRAKRFSQQLKRIAEPLLGTLVNSF